MEWVPEELWLSYLRLDAPAGDLDYDLAVSTSPERAPSPVDAGIRLPQEAIAIRSSSDWTVAAYVVAVLAVLGVVAVGSRRTLGVFG
jgi:hypothetical protein